MKETDKYWWRRLRNRQYWWRQRNGEIDVKETDMETLKKQTNIGGDGKETDKYWWRR